MKPRVRQHMGLVTSMAILALVLGGSSLGHAIFDGTLDGTLHPNVGLVVAQGRAGKFTPCSGSLIAPTVFVTAAHCLEFIQGRDATQVWVTFDSQANVDTSPLMPGTMHPNPAYDANAPDPNDVAVITFDTPVAGITPAALPPPGLLDELGHQNGLNDQSFTVVGYGANAPDGEIVLRFRYEKGPERIVRGRPATSVRDLNRRYSTSGLNAFGQALLRLSMTPAKGVGASGDAIFLGQSNTAIAIVGVRSAQGIYQGYRLDIPSARAFLASFVTLPS